MLVAKLFAYGFDDKAHHFIYDYLRHRKQRTKIVDSYSLWQEILYGVPQGSILGPLLFNADLCDLFITMSQYGIANYADDNTLYVSGRNIEEVVASLEEVSEVIFQALTIELYKVVNRFSSDIMKDVFSLNADSFYKTRDKRTFHSRHIKTVQFGSETLSHLASKIYLSFGISFLASFKDNAFADSFFKHL